MGKPVASLSGKSLNHRIVDRDVGQSDLHAVKFFRVVHQANLQAVHFLRIIENQARLKTGELALRDTDAACHPASRESWSC